MLNVFRYDVGNMGHRLPLARVFWESIGCNVFMLSYRGQVELSLFIFQNRVQPADHHHYHESSDTASQREHHRKRDSESTLRRLSITFDNIPC